MITSCSMPSSFEVLGETLGMGQEHGVHFAILREGGAEVLETGRFVGNRAIERGRDRIRLVGGCEEGKAAAHTKPCDRDALGVDVVSRGQGLAGCFDDFVGKALASGHRPECSDDASRVAALIEVRGDGHVSRIGESLAVTLEVGAESVRCRR